MAAELSLDWVLANIKDPERWTDPEILLQVLRETPSVRGMVYGNLAEVQFAHWLDQRGVPLASQTRDDDHAKTKSDRTFPYKGKRYTVQVKSLQTNSITEVAGGVFEAKIQCDASDRREVKLPNGESIETTCYVAGEFDVLATSLHPFTGRWEFAFRLNSTLPRSRGRSYSEEIREHLLATLVPIVWPLPEDGPWTGDLFGLLENAPDLGEVVAEAGEREIVRPPGTDVHVLVEETAER